MKLENLLEILGINPSEVPANSNGINLYTNFGSTPLAKLFLNEKGYTLRFASEKFSSNNSTLDVLPSGGIRVKSNHKS